MLQSLMAKLEEGNTNFYQVKKAVSSLSIKQDLEGLEGRVDQLYAAHVIDNVMKDLEARQQEELAERMKDVTRKEFQICTKYGSRKTR